MSTKVLLADDADIIRKAIAALLNEEPSIELVGEALDFAQTVQMVADLKPEVLLLDLHLADKPQFPPELIKCQLANVPHLVAVSFANDEEALALAQSYGASVLLDKIHLYKELIPAIRNCLGSPKALSSATEG